MLTTWYLSTQMTTACCLLGIRWCQDDTALPFGLSSAPKIFVALLDALVWILQAGGVTHQLDDFLLVGPPNSPVCAQALRQTLEQLAAPKWNVCWGDYLGWMHST
jgi:hypothetical protein